MKKIQEEEEKKASEMAAARSMGNMGQAGGAYSARSMFAGYVQKEKEEEVKVPVKPDVSLERKTNDLSSSRVEVNNSSVPPWIEKLRKNKN